jgi:hypothetical protein
MSPFRPYRHCEKHARQNRHQSPRFDRNPAGLLLFDVANPRGLDADFLIGLGVGQGHEPVLIFLCGVDERGNLSDRLLDEYRRISLRQVDDALNVILVAIATPR